MTTEQLRKIKLPRDPYYIEEYSAHDDHGDYMTGTFMHGKTVVIVSRVNGKWHLSIKANNPLGMQQIAQIRYAFVPDDAKMAHLLPARELRHEDNTHINLWEV